MTAPEFDVEESPTGTLVTHQVGMGALESMRRALPKDWLPKLQARVAAYDLAARGALDVTAKFPKGMPVRFADGDDPVIGRVASVWANGYSLTVDTIFGPWVVDAIRTPVVIDQTLALRDKEGRSLLGGEGDV